MLARCYSGYTLKSNPAYAGCAVCEEWLTFSKFKDWFEKNYRIGTQLDKDIIVPGNKVYSPDTCCFVPQEINKVFKGHARVSGISVGVRKQNQRYVAEFRTNGIRYKKSFSNLNDAERFYQEHKKRRIRELADSYRDNNRIDDRTYNALVRYGMEIH